MINYTGVWEKNMSEEKKRYKQVYKCRLCGERFGVGRATSSPYECKIQAKYRIENMPYATHECFGGGIGVCDFLGYEVENE